MALIQCPECGKEISESAPSCPNCGYIMSSKSSDNELRHNNEKKIPASLIKSVVLVIIIITLIIGYNNVLWGDDKKAYDIAVKCAEMSFKDPTSLQLISGKLGVDKDCMWCKTMAKNSYGSIVTDYYFFDDDGHIADASDYKDNCEEMEFNVSKVNRALKRHFS